MRDRRLIINADDYGLAPGVTRGIDEAMSAGIVTSTSVLVNMPGWEDAAARLRHAPPCGVRPARQPRRRSSPDQGAVAR